MTDPIAAAITERDYLLTAERAYAANSLSVAAQVAYEAERDAHRHTLDLLRTAEARATEAEARFARLGEEVADLTERLAKAEERLASRTHTALTKRAEEAEADAARGWQLAEERFAEIERARGIIDGAKVTISDLESRLAETEHRLDVKAKQHEEMRAERDRLREEVTAARLLLDEDETAAQQLRDAVDDSLPVYALCDDDSDEANHVERIEYAGNELKTLRAEVARLTAPGPASDEQIAQAYVADGAPSHADMLRAVYNLGLAHARTSPAPARPPAVDATPTDEEIARELWDAVDCDAPLFDPNIKFDGLGDRGRADLTAAVGVTVRPHLDKLTADLATARQERDEARDAIGEAQAEIVRLSAPPVGSPGAGPVAWTADGTAMMGLMHLTAQPRPNGAWWSVGQRGEAPGAGIFSWREGNAATVDAAKSAAVAFALSLNGAVLAPAPVAEPVRVEGFALPSLRLHATDGGTTSGPGLTMSTSTLGADTHEDGSWHLTVRGIAPTEADARAQVEKAHALLTGALIATAALVTRPATEQAPVDGERARLRDAVVEAAKVWAKPFARVVDHYTDDCKALLLAVRAIEVIDNAGPASAPAERAVTVEEIAVVFDEPEDFANGLRAVLRKHIGARIVDQRQSLATAAGGEVG